VCSFALPSGIVDAVLAAQVAFDVLVAVSSEMRWNALLYRLNTRLTDPILLLGPRLSPNIKAI
jgi:hypothetical protein